MMRRPDVILQQCTLACTDRQLYMPNVLMAPRAADGLSKNSDF